MKELSGIIMSIGIMLSIGLYLSSVTPSTNAIQDIELISASLLIVILAYVFGRAIENFKRD